MLDNSTLQIAIWIIRNRLQTCLKRNCAMIV